MSQFDSVSKRLLVGVVIAALAFGGFGVAAVSAATTTPNPVSGRLQANGAWLGVGVSDESAGVTVQEVTPGSPADDAGLRAGDVIESVDGTAITSGQQLVDTIQSYAPGDEITLRVSYRGESRDVQVTLAERPANLQPSAPVQEMPFGGLMSFLGLQTTSTDQGVRIDSIDPASPLAKSDLQAGDVVTQINGTAVSDLTPADLMQFLQSGTSLTLTVMRDGEEMEVTLDQSVLGNLPSMMPVAPQEGGNEQQGEQNEGAEQPQQGIGPSIGGAEMIFHMMGLGLTRTADGFEVMTIQPNAPAASTDLQVGDVITAVNGTAVNDLTLQTLMQIFSQGDVFTLSITRDGSEMSIDVQPPQGFNFQQGAVNPPSQLGVQYVTITPEIATDQSLSVEQGALIEQVYDNTPAAEAGLQADDIITAVDSDAVDQEHTLADRLYAYEEGDTVTLSVLRNGDEMSIDVTLGPSPRNAVPGYGMGRGYGFGPGYHMGPGFGMGRGNGFGPGYRGNNQTPNYRGRIPFFGQQGQSPYNFGNQGNQSPGQRFFREMPNGQNFFNNHPFMAPGNQSQSDSTSPVVPQQPAQDAQPAAGTPA